MAAPARGYRHGMPEDGAAMTGSDAPATTRELVQLLEEQHEELGRTLDRVPELHGAAREDVFLQARRLLAVHETLERMLVATGGAGPGEESSLAADVSAAERLDHESVAFDEAFARIVTGHLDHTREQAHELTRKIEALSDEDRARVVTAVRMWQGEGEAYLGNSYAEMLAAAEEQLECPEPVPLPSE